MAQNNAAPLVVVRESRRELLVHVVQCILYHTGQFQTSATASLVTNMVPAHGGFAPGFGQTQCSPLHASAEVYRLLSVPQSTFNGTNDQLLFYHKQLDSMWSLCMAHARPNKRP